MNAYLAGAFIGSRATLREALGARGWNVVPVAAAPAAVTGAALLLLDCPLPGAVPRVRELCQAFRAAATDRLQVLVLVERATAPFAASLLADGADDLLFAPPRADELALRLERVEAQLRAGAALPGCQAEALASLVALQHAYLEELLDTAPEGILVVDGEDRVLRVNREFSRMFGYTQDEARGRPINELIAPAHLRAEASHLTERMARGERFFVETARRRKDGRLLDVSLLVSPIRVADGQIGAYGLYRDISQRKQREAALRESEQRYRTLFDQSPVGVFLCDARLRITHCNPSLLRMLQLPRQAVIGHALREMHDPRVLPAIRDGLRGQPFAYEGPYRVAATGTELWISVRGSPLLDEHGRARGGIVVLEDVSERKQAEAQLRAQAAELERVNAALRQRTREAEHAFQARTRLYATLNHELRTPISAVMLYNELLLHGTLGPLAEEQRQAVAHSLDAATQLSALVNDVLDLARAESGRLTLRPEPIDLAALVQSLFATLRPLAAQAGSALRLEADAPAPPLLADPLRVRQVLLNLLSNAIKFGLGRPVTVRWQRLPAGELGLEVQDEGIGIAAADLPLVFEDFVQLGGPQERGTGLGLAIARRLAHLLGGRLEVESQPGHGSTFRLVLPLQPRAALDATLTPTPVS